MDKSLERLAGDMLPGLAGPVPSQIVQLAGSLVVQSRTKASALKPEEEIARSYACVHMACERLRNQLALPKLDVRPPCAPRTYKNLYAYLGGALLAVNTGAPRNKKARTQEPARPARAKDRTSRTTIRKSPATVTASRRIDHGIRQTTSIEPPEWVMPAIRQLCLTLEAPAAPPHIYAGVSSMLNESALKTIEADGVAIKIPALIIAISTLVTTRLVGVKTEAEQYARRRAQGLQLMRELAATQSDMGIIEAEDVNAVMRRIATTSWVKMDWFQNVPLGAGLAIGGLNEENSKTAEEEDDIDPALRNAESTYNQNVQDSLQANQLLPGLGTMMNAKVDYLSDEYRRSYQEWRQDFDQRLNAVTAENEQANRMEVSMP